MTAALPASLRDDTAQLRISVILCTYQDNRFELLLAAIDSVLQQTRPVHELIVVVDHNDDLARRLRAERSEISVVANAEAAGPSGARNTGAKAASGDIVAFLDDDAIAGPEWLTGLIEPYEDPAVVGVGGGAVPNWEGPPATWLPKEFYWVIGCTWRGLPAVRSTTRNFIGLNMSFRRTSYLEAGGLSTNFYFPDRAIVNEETEFCIRLTQTFPNKTLMFVPDLVVQHFVPIRRTSFRFFVRRCWREGRAKRIVTRMVGVSAGLSRERAHLGRVIPTAIAAALREAARGRPAALARVPALVIGTIVTVVAYLVPPPSARSIAAARRDQ